MADMRRRLGLVILAALVAVCLGMSSDETAKERRRRQASVPGSGRVGQPCVFNTDCLPSGMFCSGGLCSCTSTFVAQDDFCYPRANPNDPCSFDVQCTAVWPGTTCTAGTCVCAPAGDFVPRETRDGWVCVSTAANANLAPLEARPNTVCPLPVEKGQSTALGSITCVVGDTSTLVPTTAGTAGCVLNSEYVGDIYDCMVNVADPPTGTGQCCPSRALACASPRSTGTVAGDAAETRFWYNSVTGACESYAWFAHALDQTANNFVSLDHCESYCGQTCSRGSPEYEPIDVASTLSLENYRPISCDTTTCNTQYDCSNFGTNLWCCPKPTFICGERGGRLLTTAAVSPNVGFSSGNPRSVGQDGSTHWYYVNGVCRPFIYGGAGGNFNNFRSQQDCISYCQRLLCTRGNPLKGAAGTNQACNNDAACPSTHACTNSVCCPRAQTVCSQPAQTGSSCGGTSTSSTNRYYYDAETRECRLFGFSGCNGNDNNFPTLVDCQNFCRGVSPEPQCIQGQAYRVSGSFLRCSATGVGTSCPPNYQCYFDGANWGCCPTRSFTCAESVNPGSNCGPSSIRWYYDTTSQTCQTFQFSGCDGNSNNFPNRQQCEGYCGVGGCPNGGAPYQDSTGRTVVCGAVGVACPSSHECSSVNVGGSAINYCCPTRARICTLPQDRGRDCGNTMSRYYFNRISKRCQSFTYGGCDGNANNFATLAQCDNFCSSSACDAGKVIFVNPNSGSPLTCNAAIENSCPTNYLCRSDALIDASVCCGATNMGVCPSDEIAFIDALTLATRECLPNIAGSCPGNYLCRFNNRRNRYFCCASATGALCPAGRAAFRQTNRDPVRCTLSAVTNICPSTYTCQSAVANAFQGYCCSQNNICPGNVDFLTDTTTGNPRACTISSFLNCPTGYACQSSIVGSSSGFCCRGTSPNRPDGCPPNLFVYLVNGAIQQCNPFDTTSAQCPSGYNCQWSNSNTQYQCCGSQPVTQPPIPADGCPDAQISFRDPASNAPRVCTTVSNNCPTGYFCQYAPVRNQFQCCGVSAGCPNNRVSFITTAGQPQQCNLGQANACPSGFSCQLTQTNQPICCTSDQTTTCQPNQVRINGVCLNRVNPNQACQDSAQCLGGSSCSGGICACPAGTVASGSACIQQPITCSSTEVLVGTQCFPLRSPGQSCTQPQQCQGGSTCTGNVCNCPAGQTSLNGVCGITACGSNEVRVSGACYPRVTIGQFCFVTQQCLGNSRCVNSRCACAAGQQNQGGTCVTTPPATATCSVPGQTPYLEPGTSQVRFCTPGFAGNCPTNYNCQFSPTARQNICCGSPVAVTNVCPSGSTPNLLAGSPQICTGNTFGCPSGYSCQYSTLQRQYYCCTTSTPSPAGDGCPAGQNAFYSAGASVPQACTTSSPFQACPGGYACTYSATRFSFICCGSGTGVPTTGVDGCSRGRALIYPPTGTPAQCTSQPDNCPASYACEFSSVNRQFQCCSATLRQATRNSAPSQSVSSNNNAARNATTASTGRQVTCPSYQVLVTRVYNGKQVKTCASSCPNSQINIGGICQLPKTKR